MLSRLGRSTLAFIIFLIEISHLIGQACVNLLLTFKCGSRPVLRVLSRQIYFTGIEALKVILVIGAAVGIAIVSQILSLNAAGGGSLIGKLLIWTVLRELAPLITALVVIARSGSAIAAEIGHMNISGEIEHLEALGIPAEHYLLMPRIFGVTISIVVLTIYFALVSFFASFAAASMIWHISAEQFTQGILTAFTLKEFVLCITKSLFFGLIISTVGCRQGLNVGSNINQIPQAATKSVVQSLMMVFAANVALSILFFRL